MVQWKLLGWDRRSEPMNMALRRSGRLDDTEGYQRREIRGPTKLVKIRGSDEMDSKPEDQKCGMQSSQWSPRKRCDIEWEALETSTAIPDDDPSPRAGRDRVKHFVP